MMIPGALIQCLAAARSVAVLTGAGVSAESGVPTFRDAQTGLWAKYKPEDLATPTAFRKNPRLVWEWYAWRRKLVADAKPNPAHFALVELEQRVLDPFGCGGIPRPIQFHGGASIANGLSGSMCLRQRMEQKEAYVREERLHAM